MPLKDLCAEQLVIVRRSLGARLCLGTGYLHVVKPWMVSQAGIAVYHTQVLPGTLKHMVNGPRTAQLQSYTGQRHWQNQLYSTLLLLM